MPVTEIVNKSNKHALGLFYRKRKSNLQPSNSSTKEKRINLVIYIHVLTVILKSSFNFERKVFVKNHFNIQVYTIQKFTSIITIYENIHRTQDL